MKVGYCRYRSIVDSVFPIVAAQPQENRANLLLPTHYLIVDSSVLLTILYPSSLLCV